MARLIIDRGVGRQWIDNINENFRELFQGMTIGHAENEVLKTYGDTVSVSEKGKSLHKFGRNEDIDGPIETVWTLGGDEVYPTSNIIDTMSSSDAGDTTVITIEGHTVSGTGTSAEFTFVIQTATLNGQNKVTLGTPLARVSRSYNNGTSTHAGDVYIYEDTAITAGVPNDATKNHIKIQAGEEQSYKGATTFSNTDYFFLSRFYASVSQKTTAVCDFTIEVREVGKLFRPRFEVSTNNAGLTVPFDPMIIIPKNADIRIRAGSSTTNVAVEAGFFGYLAAVQ